MTPSQLRDILGSPRKYARELYETMAEVRRTDSGGKEIWDLWSELPIQETESWIDAFQMMVVDPVRQLIQEYDERIMILKVELDAKSKDRKAGPEVCYYCSSKYAISNNACGDCLNNG